MTTFGYLGSGDASGDWMDATGTYMGSQITLAGGGAIYASSTAGYTFLKGFEGLTFMKNILVRNVDLWDSANNLYKGQLYPRND